MMHQGCFGKPCEVRLTWNQKACENTHFKGVGGGVQYSSWGSIWGFLILEIDRADYISWAMWDPYGSV